MPTSMLEFVPTQRELSVVAAILGCAQTVSGPLPSFGGIARPDASTVIDILQRSGLSYEDLVSIWSIADEDEDGNLSERELAIAVRLIGWAQSGKPVNHNFSRYSNGPLPTLKGVWENEWNETPVIQLPPVNVFDRTEFQRAFRAAGPTNGLLDGIKVRDIFIKTNLSFEQLDQVWNLVDTEQRGSLNSLEFAVGMYLIQAIKSRQLAALPTSIPQHIYDQFQARSSSPFAAQDFPVQSNHPQHSWKSPLSGNVTGHPTPTLGDQWDVPIIEQAEANGHFDILDTNKTGFVDGDESARFMIKFFRLSPSDIAIIWDLVDLRGDNKLNKDQLAVAVHLIHGRLEGCELPSLELPLSLIPPSMRTKPSINRCVSAPLVPQKVPLPSSPQSKKLPTSIPSPNPPKPPLKRAASFSTNPVNPRPPRTLGSDPRNRFSIAAIPEAPSSVSSSAPSPIHTILKKPSAFLRVRSPPAVPVLTFSTPPSRPPSVPHTPPPPPLTPPLPRTRPLQTPSNPPHAAPVVIKRASPRDQEVMAEMRAEAKQLKAHIEELMSQLKGQSQHRDHNDELMKENKELKERLQDLEVSLSQVLQANEGSDRTDELSREVARLTQLLAGHEDAQVELHQTLRSTVILAQENQSLKQKFEDLKVEKTSLEKELKEPVQKIHQVESERNSLVAQLKEIEKSLADPQAGRNGEWELLVLLKDVMKENEVLKHRGWEVQDQISSALLTSHNEAQVDDLRRENSRFRRDAQELEEVLRSMQVSNSDDQLRRRISELEREKGRLNGQLTEMARQEDSTKELSRRRIEELERRRRELETTNQTLRRRQTVGGRYDANIAPPAYELTVT